MGLFDWIKRIFQRRGKEEEETTFIRRYPKTNYRSPSWGRRSRSLPGTIGKYYISSAVLLETQHYIEEHGKNVEEAYLFWAGGVADKTAYITTCIYPNVKTRRGGVAIPSRKMTKINKKLEELDQIILAQVHSHPTSAQHSSLDEEKAVSFHEGFISIVVPNFGAPPVYDLRQVNVYIYSSQQGWSLLDEQEVTNQFSVEEVKVEV